MMRATSSHRDLGRALTAIALVTLASDPELPAAPKSPKLAKCEGKRRPANVHGSILPSVDPAKGEVTPSKGIHLFAPGKPPSGPVDADEDGKVPLVPPIGAMHLATDRRSC